MRHLLAFAALLHGTPALAGSIGSPGVAAGPDSTAATPDPAAVHFNPAAIAATEGFQALVDLQLASISVEALAFRNDGIDPNTGEPYRPAQANVLVPVAFLGATYKVIPDRLAVGFAIHNPFTGGGDYMGSELDGAPPYTGHQRYAGVQTRIISLSFMPAVGVTVIDGVHVGGGVSYAFDSISVLQASDPLGTEGRGFGEDAAYATDFYLQGQGTGGHLGWNAGLFFDRFKQLQVGVSYSGPSTFRASGTGSLDAPDLLTQTEGRQTVPALVEFELPLPAVARVFVRSELDDRWTVGAGWEYWYWFDCCGGPDGDIYVRITNEDGQPIGEEDGLALTVNPDIYSPRRLWSHINAAAIVGFQATDDLWVGGRFGFNQNAVPDHAVSATNLDFNNLGGMLAARYRIGGGPVTVGLAYSKFFPLTREITTSAWDVRDRRDPHYVDDRFSQATPYRAGTNGTYSARSDILGVRLGVGF